MSQIIKSEECTNYECRAVTGEHLSHQGCIGENCAHWQPMIYVEKPQVGVQPAWAGYKEVSFAEEASHGKCGLSS